MRNIKVMLNGPYGAYAWERAVTMQHRGLTVMIPLLGGPGHAVVNSFSGAMLVAGGSGITYALSTVQELITKSAESASRTRVVELVWCITDPSEYSLPPPYHRALILGRHGHCH